MSDKNYGFVEHVAVSVTDMNWHINLFSDVFGMMVTKHKGALENPEIAWLSGGIQLLRKSQAEVCGVDHLGIVVTDLDAVLHLLKSIPGVTPAAGKDFNWIVLSEGIILELIQGNVEAINLLKNHPLRG